MRLRTQRIYEPSSSSDGLRVLVDRLWPRGLSKAKARVDLWAKEVAPSKELRRWYGHEPEKWPEFKRRYAVELEAAGAAVAELEAAIAGGPATLLFSSKEESLNNAAALREYLLRRREPGATLLRILDQAYRGPSWHGPNLRTALRKVDAETAAWRPGPGRHSIWELAIHAAYWKYRVYRALTEEPPRSFGIAGSNFFERPGDGASWPEELGILADWHHLLSGAVAAFDPERLSEPVGKNRYSYTDLISGVAAHDVYHAGQIVLIRRLQGA
jgi:uncharacterized protein YeaO (DUF488 family)